ncbi:hypothetical protein LZ198_24610 [Myxococcus sp. K15C18031901]|uniref:hypothetical protein n=1 Tax=Myxococcus dinghuensis TaxID=2906761 RepID=UPI0020A8319B|nr:hypothetical protein [Myxococcus dinghuensis]MCP3102054.1 hypothetical protein [Myxococcus dinghuensis]
MNTRHAVWMGTWLLGVMGIGCGDDPARCPESSASSAVLVSALNPCEGPGAEPFCGDGVCTRGESLERCARDCVAPCGNGVCDSSESQDTCPSDCGG